MSGRRPTPSGVNSMNVPMPSALADSSHGRRTSRTISGIGVEVGHGRYRAELDEHVVMSQDVSDLALGQRSGRRVEDRPALILGAHSTRAGCREHQCRTDDAHGSRCSHPVSSYLLSRRTGSSRRRACHRRFRPGEAERAAIVELPGAHPYASARGANRVRTSTAPSSPGRLVIGGSNHRLSMVGMDLPCVKAWIRPGNKGDNRSHAHGDTGSAGPMAPDMGGTHPARKDGPPGDYSGGFS